MSMAARQHGNNNAYCQDNELSWIDWRHSKRERDLFEWTRRLIQLRNDHPALHRRKFFQGRGIHGRQVYDVEWYRPDGHEMNDEEWSEARVRCLGMLLNGQLMDEWDERGKHIHDDILLLLLNANANDVPFVLPRCGRRPILGDADRYRAPRRQRAALAAARQNLPASGALAGIAAPTGAWAGSWG